MGIYDSNKRSSQSISYFIDSTTWIFDDRKVTIDDLERGVFDGSRPINFDDNKEWNRAILEGQTNPPTLDSEIKYKNVRF